LSPATKVPNLGKSRAPTIPENEKKKKNSLFYRKKKEGFGGVCSPRGFAQRSGKKGIGKAIG